MTMTKETILSFAGTALNHLRISQRNGPIIQGEIGGCHWLAISDLICNNLIEMLESIEGLYSPQKGFDKVPLFSQEDVTKMLQLSNARIGQLLKGAPRVRIDNRTLVTGPNLVSWAKIHNRQLPENWESYTTKFIDGSVIPS